MQQHLPQLQEGPKSLHQSFSFYTTASIFWTLEPQRKAGAGHISRPQGIQILKGEEREREREREASSTGVERESHPSVLVFFEMDACKNPPSATSSLLGDLIPASIMEGEDEWLSIYVEDCLSSATSYYTNFNFNPLPSSLPSSTPPQTTLNITPKSSSPFKSLAIPGKARTKRRRITLTPRNLSLSTTYSPFHLTPSSDPPLLHQTYWLAESQLILPKKEQEEQEQEASKTPPALEKVVGVQEEDEDEEEEEEEKEGEGVQQPRRCTHCLSQKTPQWRAGPLGPKTLCNACGVRFKSGRLLPEYRPAKSPTFVSYKHSNSHKKVMMMRMALMSTPNTNCQVSE